LLRAEKERGPCPESNTRTAKGWDASIEEENGGETGRGNQAQTNFKSYRHGQIFGKTAELESDESFGGGNGRSLDRGEGKGKLPRRKH